MEASSESEDDVTDPWKEDVEDDRGTTLPQRISSKLLNKATSTCEGDR